MDLRELSRETRCVITIECRFDVPDGTFENPYRCYLEGAVAEKVDWSHFRIVSSAGKTIAQAWERLADDVRGQTLHFHRNGVGEYTRTLTVPADLLAGDPP